MMQEQGNQGVTIQAPRCVADVREELMKLAATLEQAAISHEVQANGARAAAAIYMEAASKLTPTH